MAYSLESVAQPQTFWNFNIDAGTWHGPCGPVNNKSRREKDSKWIWICFESEGMQQSICMLRWEAHILDISQVKSRSARHAMSRLNSMTRRSVASLGRSYSLEICCPAADFWRKCQCRKRLQALSKNTTQKTWNMHNIKYHPAAIVNVHIVFLEWAIIWSELRTKIARQTRMHDTLETRPRRSEELTWLLSLVEFDELERFH